MFPGQCTDMKSSFTLPHISVSVVRKPYRNWPAFAHIECIVEGARRGHILVFEEWLRNGNPTEVVRSSPRLDKTACLGMLLLTTTLRLKE